MDDDDKMLALCEIMEKAHALAECAWPRDGEGKSDMPEAGLHAIMDIQTAACRALDLPEDTPLMTGDPTIDL